MCKSCQSIYFDVNKALSIQRCSCCGKELISTKNLCSQCKEKPLLLHTDKVIPIFSYRLWNKELLFDWKINNVRVLSSLFAKLYSQVLKKEHIEFIVPIPPRPGKIKENGWDQIDEVCTYLKYMYGFKVLNLLERYSKQQQKKLDRDMRLETTKTSYGLRSENNIARELNNLNVKNLKVCIIDDVCTTGATLEACARLLKAAGIGFVEAVTLFTVD